MTRKPLLGIGTAIVAAVTLGAIVLLLVITRDSQPAAVNSRAERRQAKTRTMRRRNLRGIVIGLAVLAAVAALACTSSSKDEPPVERETGRERSERAPTETPAPPTATPISTRGGDSRPERMAYAKPVAEGKWASWEDTELLVAKDQLIIVAEHGATIDQVSSALEDLGGSIVGEIPSVGIYQVEFPSDLGLQEAMEFLEQAPEVVAAFPNPQAESSRTPPPSISPHGIWFDLPGSAYLQEIRAPEAWTINTGSEEVTIGIVDSGVDEIPDFRSKIVGRFDLGNPDSKSPDTSPDRPADITQDAAVHAYHGTVVAGVAAAAANDDYGMTGVSWGSTLAVVKMWKGGKSLFDLAAGIDAAIDLDAKVINVSGGSPVLQAWLDGMKAVVERAARREVLIVAAGANHGFLREIQYSLGAFPAWYAEDHQNVIAVGSTENGEGTFVGGYGASITVSAPREVLGYSPFLEFNPALTDGSRSWSGTSFATPQVSGLAALIWSLDHDHNGEFTLSPADVREIITETTTTPPPGETRTGAGVIDAAAALRRAANNLGIPIGGGGNSSEAFARNPALDFNALAAAGNSAPEDLWTDGTTVWVSDSHDRKLYAYGLATKQRDGSKDIDTLAGGHGIWSDGTTMWVAYNTRSEESKIYAYSLATKQHEPAKDFNSLADAGNLRPDGIWSDGTTMWVADWDDGKLYAYRLATKQRDPANDFNSLATTGNHNPDGVWSDETTMWVSDPIDRKIYAYNLKTGQPDGAKDFNTLAEAGNDNPAGIWSDGTTIWVTDWGDSKIYAYNMLLSGSDPRVPEPSVLQLEYATSASEVAAGESFILTVRVQDHQQEGVHRYVSAHFPLLTQPGGSRTEHSSSVADVEVLDYTNGLSKVTFYQPATGLPIYYVGEPNPRPAKHLGVSAWDTTLPPTPDRTLRLRITPKRAGPFPMHLVASVCTAGHTHCWQYPVDGAVLNQQGHAAALVSVQVSGTPAQERFLSVSAGYDLSCGLLEGGSVRCWGRNEYGQATPPEGRFLSVSAGARHSCGLLDSGSVICWGYDEEGRATPPTGQFKSINAGRDHSCGLLVSVSVRCWGDDYEGRATPPDGIFLSVSAGGYHSCGVTDGGSIRCWGKNAFGQSSPPEGRFQAVSVGASFSCGLEEDGSLYCWGYNQNYETTPPNRRFLSVSTGDNHGCGVVDGGLVLCWGKNDEGQATPPEGRFLSVSLGYNHSCGVMEGGSVICWGDDTYGEATPPK